MVHDTLKNKVAGPFLIPMGITRCWYLLPDKLMAVNGRHSLCVGSTSGCI